MDPLSGISADEAWVRPTDAEDWFELAPSLKWRFASTMREVPHSYVVRHKTLDNERYRKAFGAIRTFGTPGNFYSRTNLYLRDPNTGDRWWLMSRHEHLSKILNQATDGKMYGDQVAPDTTANLFSPYDHIGAYYDDTWSGVTNSERTALWRTANELLGGINPKTLDLGAGTGGTLDSRIAGAKFTTAVDVSQAMLNDLVMKHPNIQKIIPASAEEYLSWETGAVYDLVTASYGSASYLSPEVIELLPSIAKYGVILSFYAQDYRPLYYRRGEFELETSEALQLALDYSKGAFEEHGNYLTVTIRGAA